MAIPVQAAAAAAVGAAALLTACGGGGDGGGGSPNGSAAPAPPASPRTLSTAGQSFTTAGSDPEAARFLLQAQFSASEAEIAAVRSMGYAGWLGQQMGATSTTGWDWLESKGYGDPFASQRWFDQSAPGDHMVWNQLLTSTDAVRKRVALALSEFFVVSLASLDFTWRSHAIAAWWDLLAAHAFGNFRTLLEAVTLSPAMGYYLNTRGNQRENAATGRQPDENYAREVMQLMTIGLVQLNADGTEQRDAQGNKIDSYTQSDVTNLARVFTGWDFDQSQNQPVNVNGRNVPSTLYTRLPMALNASRHSTLASTFLGTTIPANTPGAAALRQALDTLFHHPNVGPFFARQMIQRLVTSNPSPAYVGRVAATFNNNGAGVRGDLGAVFGAILLDDEARSPQGLVQPAFGKLREPMLRFVQWGRTFGLASASDAWRIGDLGNAATQLGQSPLRSPSVFNFFRPGYVPPSTALAATQAVAPEFQIVNESSVGGYLNFMQNTVRNGVGSDLQPAYTTELVLAADPAALVGRLSLLLCAGQLGGSNAGLIINAIGGMPTNTDAARRNRVAAAVLMVMASPEYLVQK
ncbi:MAG TPA: DUF1800 domain-containing protein [Ramlibacter sp.]|nr:DUF1800 domain-containing protein [Ramlibacter sp.]